PRNTQRDSWHSQIRRIALPECLRMYKTRLSFLARQPGNPDFETEVLSLANEHKLRFHRLHLESSQKERGLFSICCYSVRPWFGINTGMPSTTGNAIPAS